VPHESTFRLITFLSWGLPHSREYSRQLPDFLLQDQDELLHPQSRIRDVQQISRDKLDCFSTRNHRIYVLRP